MICKNRFIKDIIMRKRISLSILSVLVLSLFVQNIAEAQVDGNFRMKLESILSRFKNYRYSQISIYEISDIQQIRKAIKAQEELEGLGAMGAEATADASVVAELDGAVANAIERGVQSGQTETQVQRQLIMNGLPVPENLTAVYNYYYSRIAVATKQLRNAYVITTRMTPDKIVPHTIIAMIVSYEDETFIEDNIDNPNPGNVYTRPELINFLLPDDEDYAADNMYGLVVNAFQQGLVEDVTLESQGIGSFASFAPRKYGVSKSLIDKESEINEYDIQKFIRISEGQPNDIINKHNELVVGPDLISWKNYETPRIVYDDGYVDTLSDVNNMNLPKIGFELKYGNESINYPSFWSERMTASAIWQNTKLGIILPTSGWAGVTEDLNIGRKLTFGGVGVASEIDFPVRVIPKSGIFSMKLGYVFGDAQEADYKNLGYENGENLPLNYNQELAAAASDYLIRFNGQLHYTFALAIDKNYHLRFGLGGTVYSVESWYFKPQEDEIGVEKLAYEMDKTDVIGGVSAKVDFMVKNASTPFGATLQYFDEGIFSDLWLQIPILKNTLALNIGAKGYYKLFPDNIREWEQESMFIPSVRAIVNF
jgi:hypothetical protein